jgi:tRNA(Ile)-lysidine synthase
VPFGQPGGYCPRGQFDAAIAAIAGDFRMTNKIGSAELPLLPTVRDALRMVTRARGITAGPVRVAVALSGGRDSMALLDGLSTLAPELGLTLSALHVHHGLSIHADAWAKFCGDECAQRGLPLTVHRAVIRRVGGKSLEAEARAARYAAFVAADADIVALAHHADDQAETLLLQLLRGAGPHGLAAMPAYRPLRNGPALLRPFLALPRAAIDAYAAARGLAWVDDESNANTGVKRNFIRHDVAPRLAAAFPGYPATFVRTAAHQAEAARLIDDMAQHDALGALAEDSVAGVTLDRAALIALAAHAPHRARNLLRWFLRQHKLSAPSAARLAAMLDQLSGAASTRGSRSGSTGGASRCTRPRSPRSQSRGSARCDWHCPTARWNSRPAPARRSPAPGWTGSRSRFGPGPEASASGSPMIARAGH